MNYNEATDEMKAHVLAVWRSATTQYMGAIQPMLFQGVTAAIPASPALWARLSINTVDQGQSKLSDMNFAGAKTHTAIGNVFVQVFMPIAVADSWRKGTLIANKVKNALALRTASGTVWFRNPRIAELDPEQSFHRLNVVAEFEYDEVVNA